jgi:Glutathione-dependent formaldehyde-activating enzyme
MRGISGGCACGAIRYVCDAEPLFALNCHCRACQRESGGAYIPVLAVPKNSFALIKGTPRQFTVTADSGHPTIRVFVATADLLFTDCLHRFPKSLRFGQGAWTTQVRFGLPRTFTRQARSPGITWIPRCRKRSGYQPMVKASAPNTLEQSGARTFGRLLRTGLTTEWSR